MSDPPDKPGSAAEDFVRWRQRLDPDWLRWCRLLDEAREMREACMRRWADTGETSDLPIALVASLVEAVAGRMMAKLADEAHG